MNFKNTKRPAGFILTFCIALFFSAMTVPFNPASAQAVLFDFDNAPQYTPLPIDQTAGGITAHLSATGQGYSIQAANVLGFTPPGFAGNIIYPSSIYLSDLLISFSQVLNSFSIMYSPQELGCDDSAILRVTAYLNGSFVGTNTRTATVPGTWPVDTLSCNFPQGFDSVVVHYDSHPPTCQDYGVIFMADNMYVTAYSSSVQENLFIQGLEVTNPVSQSATVSFYLLESQNIHVDVYNMQGQLIKNLFDGYTNSGKHQLSWDVNDSSINNGIFLLKLTGENFFHTCKLIVVK
jgi:Secretion system C-terminal sorting domain